MASLSFLASATTNSSPLHLPSKQSSSSSSSSSSSPPPPPPTRRFYTYCENRNSSASKSSTAYTTSTRDYHNSTTRTEKSESGSSLRLDRRNVLLGLGGLYGASALTGRGNMAAVAAPDLADSPCAPFQPPDLSKCHLTVCDEIVHCCPPYDSDTPVVDYQFPPTWKPLRVRRPAHLLENKEIEKYKEAVEKLRELTKKDTNDPRGWMQQANVHCQYCNGAYDQVGFPGLPLLVHNSWIFLPWHRWYLHFYERILGSLICDDTFALPFWNWDTPEGMFMPPIFTDPVSSLYDCKRNPHHFPEVSLDLKYVHGDPAPRQDQKKMVEENNLHVISSHYTKDVLSCPHLFMGDRKCAGQKGKLPSGGLESIHNTIHNWTGTDTKPYKDMGDFIYAARDPIFYGHHSNIDRMWEIYRCMRSYKTEFPDPGWLHSSFVFVDENKKLVKVNIADSLDPEKLRYTYEPVRIPWAEAGFRKRLIKERKTMVRARAKADEDPLATVSEFGSEPKALTRTSSTIRVLVTRPQWSRSKAEKEDAVEALVISIIEAPISQPSRFDVYLTTPDDGDNKVGPDLGELAGSFVQLSHDHQGRSSDDNSPQSNILKFKLGITTLLEDLEVESAEKLVVSLVPRLGDFTIGGVSIDLLKTQGPEN